MSNIWSGFKNVGKEAYYFFTSRIFWKNFGKQIGIIALILFLLFWVAKCFTRHGDAVKVGNYIQKNIRDVERLADDSGFEIVVTDSIYREDFPADMVLEQNPAPESYVKTGRRIYVKITTNRGNLVRLPDIKGNDQVDSYIELLDMMKIKVSKIDTVPDPNLADGTVLQVIVGNEDVYKKLGQGVNIREGSQIRLVIAKREINEREVPSFIDGGRYMTFGEYSLHLDARELQIGEIKPDASVTDENAAFVIKVSPGPRSPVMKGDSVTVFISGKNPAGTRTDSFEQ